MCPTIFTRFVTAYVVADHIILLSPATIFVDVHGTCCRRRQYMPAFTAHNYCRQWSEQNNKLREDDDDDDDNIMMIIYI